MYDGIFEEISAPGSTKGSMKNKFYTIIVVEKALSKMDRECVWLCPNKSVINELPMKKMTNLI